MGNTVPGLQYLNAYSLSISCIFGLKSSSFVLSISACIWLPIPLTSFPSVLADADLPLALLFFHFFRTILHSFN